MERKQVLNFDAEVDRLLGLLRRRPRIKERRAPHRGRAIHVVILDGTMSSLAPGHESNAGLAFKLLREVGTGANLSLYYEAGIQWRDWHGTWDVMTGKGIGRQITRTYGWLASRYRPGDEIMLLGYSRGAYAVRSLAGIVDRVGLLRADAATVRNVRLAWRHYRAGGRSEAAEAFRGLHCHRAVEIRALGCWDTVKALGVRLPIAWRWAEKVTAFHSTELGPQVRRGFQALALHETRAVFEPLLWTSSPLRPGAVEQVWFRGTHCDIGGQVGGRAESRPLSNIPLVWMLSRLEGEGLPLPAGWAARFPCDAAAPSLSCWEGWAKLFLFRKRRVVGRDPSERLHATAVSSRGRRRWGHVPAE